MKNLKLLRMTMTNFKGEVRTTKFNSDITTIAGMNGLGKSRHKDAFMWCLFGKDSEDRQDYKIITHDSNGNELHKVDSEVEIVLSCDGVTTTLRRCYGEKWVVSKGTTEEHLEGHNTKFWVDEVPMNATDYKKTVQSIIDEDIFKSLTNPNYFIRTKEWKEQRNELFRMAGTLSDEDIAKSNPEFKALLKRMNGRSFDDYKTLIRTKKNKAKKDIESNGIRIDQLYRTMTQEQDVDELNAKLQGFNEHIEEIDNAMRDRISLEDKQVDEYKDLSNQKVQLIGKQSDLVFAERQRQREIADEKNALYNKAVQDYRSIKDDIEKVQVQIDRENRSVESMISILDGRKNELKRLQEKYDKVIAEEYKDSDVCPFCGQKLPEITINDKKVKFASDKKNRLESIEEEGIEVSNNVKTLEDSIAKEQESIETAKNQIKELQTRLELVHEKLDNFDIVKPEPIDPTSVPGYNELQSKIDEISEKLSSGKPVVDNSDLIAKKNELKNERDGIVRTLEGLELRNSMLKEVEKIENNSKVCAQTVADCQREEDLIIAFYKVKIQESETRINSLFSNVTFRLSRINLKGNEEECCDAYVGGIPYGTVNSAAQINAGLDIINAYCRFYDISAPIFIDWAESINVIENTYGQQIRLKVTDDETLTIY